MNSEKNNIPHYDIRGISLWGFRDMAHFLDYLFAGHQVKTGALVAMNAEKVLTVESNPELSTLIGQAEYKYADGISIVRAIRKKYPQAKVSRIAGADLWEGLMQRAGAEGTPVFLIGGKPEILQQTEDKLRAQWNVNIAGSQNGYFTPDQRDALFERVKASGAVTIEMKTSFFRPGEGRLRAVGRLLHRSATMAFTEGHVYGGHGELCAHATGTFKYVKRLPAGHGGRAIKALNRPGEDEAQAQDPHPRTDRPR